MKHPALPIGLAILTSLAAALRGEEPPPAPPWTGNAGLGFSLTRGNADTDNVSLTAAAQYDPKARNLFKADASYLRGDRSGEVILDKTAAGVRGERRFAGRAFAFVEARYLRDRFKDIRYLITPLAGVGYHVVKTQTATLTLDASVGGAFEKDDERDGTSSGAVKAGEAFSLKISPTATVAEAATALFKTNEFADALYHFEASLSASITKRSELKVSFVDDYKNRPSDPAILKNDLAVVAAFVMKL